MVVAVCVCVPEISLHYTCHSNKKNIIDGQHISIYCLLFMLKAQIIMHRAKSSV